MRLSSVMRSTLSSINSMRFSKWLPFLLPVASWPVIALSMMAPISMILFVSVACGLRRAVGWLRKNHPEVRLSRETKATARQWLSPEDYISLLNQSGFSSVEATEEWIAMPLDSLIDLGHYWLFIEGALPGAPLAIGAEAFGSTVYGVARELNMAYLPRMWLQIVATKG